ncbi:D-alanine-D-alanine ligase [Proteiniphilum saccharofermentans]|uniref:D-alanine--D-alanine ligase n=1 Tax=Proteiniphilum saccharofermentans TaxID=1642647 RepID=A0A1R3T9C0_9BACT|nr:D-alanine--D-alanine ligase [Proteiniphilum saccharofermentans]SCD21197.1 D-alanine-D-alanine ligase [Proteiniphilum saccharofermentans]SFT04201.1 D-alanine-D-alanine ligase [Porphyromonadaceae bacterium NLAE-zl-C104]
MKKNVAIVWGGYSSEIVISEKSAAGIYSFIDKEKYNVCKVRIDRTSWEVENQGCFYPVDKNNFSFSDGEAQCVAFDFAYITIHGTPGEDGTLQGYFDMLGIPYSNCGVLTSALTFNKFICNNFLKNFGIEVADSILLRKNDPYQPDGIISRLGLPIFVKPNLGGSSFATTKVKERVQLETAVEEAFREAPEVIIESFLQGTEVTCGCFEDSKGMTVLPLTEVVTTNEFFDFDAKYNGQVEEITPARIPEEITKAIQQETQRIYRLIGAKGIIRVDYILVGDMPVLLEVNTTPGMTATSFIPQQVNAAGLSMTNIITGIIEKELSQIEK